MKLTLALLFVAFAAGAQVKSDTVVFVPKESQLKLLQQIDDQIEQLRKQQMDLILFGLGEAVDPKTIQFDGKKFKALKVK